MSEKSSEVLPGDGSALGSFQSRQLVTRSLFFLDPADSQAEGHTYAVDVRYLADSTSKEDQPKAGKHSQVALYQDGVQLNRSDLPATFPVPGGAVEVAVSTFGLKRMHFVAADGSEHLLRPHPRSAEGLRARFGQRFPRASAAVGAVTLTIMLVVLAGALLEGAEAITRLPLVSMYVGTFSSPIQLPLWAKIVLGIAGVLAALERALRVRYNALIDSAEDE